VKTNNSTLKNGEGFNFEDGHLSALSLFLDTNSIIPEEEDKTIYNNE